MAGEGHRVYIHRGLCGVSLRTQCIYIGASNVIASFLSIMISSIMLNHPIKYVDLKKLSVSSTKHETQLNGTSEGIDADGLSTMDELDELTARALHEVGANGMEFLVEGLSTLVVSVLLLHGIRKEKTAYILPWVIVSILATFANFITFMLKVSAPSSVAIGKIFGAVFYFTLSSYFILSVQSYYQILKIRKKKVITFLDHEFQGGEGNWYHTLQDTGDDVAPAHASYTDPVPTYSEAVEEYRDNKNPFRRPQQPYTEKAVPMTEEEDVGKEHVLFAKI